MSDDGDVRRRRFVLFVLTGPRGLKLYPAYHSRFQWTGPKLAPTSVVFVVGAPGARDQSAEAAIVERGSSISAYRSRWEEALAQWDTVEAARHSVEAELASDWGLSPDDLPCVVVAVAGSPDHSRFLAVDPECVAEDTGAALFWRTFGETFDADRVGAAARELQDESADALLELGEKLLVQLRSAVETPVSRQPSGIGAPPESTSGTAGYASARDLAEGNGVSYDALRKRLGRMRKRRLDDWVENESRAKGEPRYLYKVAAVGDIVAKLKRDQE